jgi:hypothetical protein
MDQIRFDRLARMVGGRASRRAALVALAGAGLGIAGVDEAAAKCGRNKPCGLCKRCRNGRCEKRKNGSICAVDGGMCQGKKCICPSDAWLCKQAPACCDTGQACFVDVFGAAGCGACPVVGDLCVDDVPQCGQFGPEVFEVCGCVTSVEGRTVCSSGFFDCVDCATDQDCTDAFGVRAVCLSVAAECSGCDSSTICMTATCEAPRAGAASGRGRALKRWPRSRITPTASR